MAKKILSIAVCCASLTGLSAEAAQSQNETVLLQKVLQRTQEMEQQVQSLQHEVVYLKSQLKAQKKAGKMRAQTIAPDVQPDYVTSHKPIPYPRASLPPPQTYQQYPSAVLPGHAQTPPEPPPAG
jgi:hypothetical protein